MTPLTNLLTPPLRKLLSLLLVLLPCLANSLNFRYELRMDEPHTHYVHVSVFASDLDGKPLVLKMPSWAPGSYLIRDFARHVEGFQAVQNNIVVPTGKSAKNTWTVFPSGNSELTITYKVYANELGVRTSHVDDTHAAILGSSVFMYFEGYKDQAFSLTVYPFHKWKVVSTALPEVPDFPNMFIVKNYDELADSPIEIGNQRVVKFKATGIEHELALYGDPVFDQERLVRDFTKIIDYTTGIFAHQPCERYVFIIHHLGKRGGGLEHANSTTLQIPRWSYSRPADYKALLSLVAHEYFHLWNVKRLRPAGLGPFDYDNEVYTDLLWFAEGFTSYYDDLIVRKTGFTTIQEYLDNVVAKSMTNITNSPGNKVQSAAASSFDAWIKQYKPDENTYNSTISYYEKGSHVALFLDLWIIQKTNGNSSLDEVMQRLYKRHHLDKDEGITEKEIRLAVAEAAGENMDWFFDKYIRGTEIIDYQKMFEPFGITVKDRNKGTNKAYMGLRYANNGNTMTVTTVEKNTSAFVYGVSAKDEIISIDGQSCPENYDKVMASRRPGETVEIILKRDGLVKTLPVTLKKDLRADYTLEMSQKPAPAQQKLLTKWLGNP